MLVEAFTLPRVFIALQKLVMLLNNLRRWICTQNVEQPLTHRWKYTPAQIYSHLVLLNLNNHTNENKYELMKN